MTSPTTSARLAEHLHADVVEHLEALLSGPFADWRVPAVFAGHRVGPDVRADLAFTLGFLHDAGITSVAGRPIVESISDVLRPIDGTSNHSFFCYRVAETIGRFGPFDQNPLTVGWSDAEVDNLAAACDATSFLPLYDEGHLPQNYAAVLARAEFARGAIGLPHDAAIVERLVERTSALLSANPHGYLDDSGERIGRYDIYTADVYLFTEPLAHLLGDIWRSGAERAIDLIDRVVADNGAAVCWGRSTGALSLCLTIELAALALGQGMTHLPGAWVGRAERARTTVTGFFSEGITSAHQGRSTYNYRGPERRLQMTFDLLGKLAESAGRLAQVADPVEALPERECFPSRHDLIRFEQTGSATGEGADEGGGAAVWSFRSGSTSFVIPFVGGSVSDYLPALRCPDTFDVPVDAPLVTGVPSIWSGHRHYAAGGRPLRVDLLADGVEAEYATFPVVGLLDADPARPPLPGNRTVHHRVDGRTISTTELLHFDQVPDAIGLQVTEISHRPLVVRFDADQPHRVDRIDTSGLKEYRSFWNELSLVHQLDVEPAPDVRIDWSVTPKIRVATSERHQHYAASIYDPLEDRAQITAFPTGRISSGKVDDALRHIDVFHLHWPEWLTNQDLDVHRRFIEAIDAAGIRVVWTQHNLEPHLKNDLSEIYTLWAARADGVIHHSTWGMEQSRSRYAFRSGAEHRVIPHLHFGHLMTSPDDLDRPTIERDRDLPPCRIRLGMVGAPRAEKDVQSVIDAFARCTRDDLGLYITCLDGESVPDDPRITALPYSFVSRRQYDEQLAVLDAIVLPYAAEGMLTTGVVGDVVGAGLAAIVSDWPYLHESLGDAGLAYDGTVDALTDLFESLTPDLLDSAHMASAALRTPYDHRTVAEQHFALFDDLLA